MKRNNKNFKSGMSLAVMFGSMAIIASIFGYFVCSWFLDYVTAPEDGVESVVKEQIVTEEEIESSSNDLISEEEKEAEVEESEETMIGQSVDETLFIVQVGAFDKEENAQGLINKLQSKGFTAYITSKNPFRVQVGAFRTRSAAEELGSELENYGFPIYIKH